MKLIICGGRDYEFTPKDEAWLDMLRVTESVSLVIEGGQRSYDEAGNIIPSADWCANQWANKRGILVHTERAKWKEHGRAAGPIRNAKMAELGEGCAVFPGGRGTASMERIAHQKGLMVFIAPIFL